MGDIFGSDTTTTSTTQPFSGDMATQFADYLKKLQTNPIGSNAYTGQLTAPMNDTQQSAITLLNGVANNPELAKFASGQYLDPATNPYLQKSADIIKQNATDQFNQTANGIDTRFNNRGFWDSSAHANTLDRAGDNANQNYDNAIASLYGNAYQTNVGNMLQAQGAQQSSANSLLNAGNTAYGISNDALQNQYKAYLTQQGFNQQDIQNFLNALNIGKNPTQTQTQEGDSGLGGLLGQVAGMYLTGGLSGGFTSTGTNGILGIR